MTLSAAIRKAKMTGAKQIYQISVPWYHKGIYTEFTTDDSDATDWQVYYPEPFIGHSGVE